MKVLKLLEKFFSYFAGLIGNKTKIIQLTRELKIIVEDINGINSMIHSHVTESKRQLIIVEDEVMLLEKKLELLMSNNPNALKLIALGSLRQKVECNKNIINKFSC